MSNESSTKKTGVAGPLGWLILSAAAGVPVATRREDLSDLDWLRRAIKTTKRMEWWKTGLFTNDAASERARAHECALKARDSFIGMMQSVKNDGSDGYLDWAIRKSLDLGGPVTYQFYSTARNFGRRRNRGMN